MEEKNRATYNVQSKDGFEALVTIVGESMEDLKEQMTKFESYLVLYGYKPNGVAKPFQKPAAPTTAQSVQPVQQAGGFGVCSYCGAEKVMGKSGKPYCKACYIAKKNAEKNQYGTA